MIGSADAKRQLGEFAIVSENSLQYEYFVIAYGR
jgi:hypothetical protein